MTYVYKNRPAATEEGKRITKLYGKYQWHLYHLYTETHKQRKDAPQLWEKYLKVNKKYIQLFNQNLGYTIRN